jgi:hypothetical protein
MSRKFKIVIRWLFILLPSQPFNGLILLQELRTGDIFLGSIRFYQKHKGLAVYAYCIISSHIHMMVARHGPHQLEHVIRDIKKFTTVIEAAQIPARK